MKERDAWLLVVLVAGQSEQFDDHGYIPALQFLGRWTKLVQIQEEVLRVFLPLTARRIYNVLKFLIQGQMNEHH
jgi:hypothetical protein